MSKKILYDKKTWLSITLICLSFSILSVFLPVITYKHPDGMKQNFNVFGFMQPEALDNILHKYTGKATLNIGEEQIPIFAVIAILAIVAAFAGVITMSAQRPNRWQFVLALVGLIGTLLPAVLLYVLVISSINHFPGIFILGAYPIITPIAMGICIYMVTRKHKLTQEEMAADRIAAQFIRTMGDLE